MFSAAGLVGIAGQLDWAIPGSRLALDQTLRVKGAVSAGAIGDTSVTLPAIGVTNHIRLSISPKERLELSRARRPERRGPHREGNGPFNDFYQYDPVADSWTQEANYPPGARWLVAGFGIGNIGYFGTGADANGYYSYQEFWEYSPDGVPPSTNFQSSDSIICENGCINFTDLSTNATSWLWSFPGAIPSTSTDQNPQTVCYLTSGLYDVTLIASNGGGSDTLSLANYITVNPAPPYPQIAQTGDTLTCSYDSTYSSYQWYYNGNIIPGATDSFYVEVLSTGNYNVAVTNQYGCSIAVGIILGINDNVSYPDFSIYPNPVTDQVHIYIPKSTGKEDITNRYIWKNHFSYLFFFGRKRN